MSDLTLERNPGYVYLIQGADLCKIGMTNSPASRLATIQTHSPVRLALVCQVESLCCMALEKRLHERFKEAREHGEWFRLSADNVKRFEDIARNEEAILRQLEAKAIEEFAASKTVKDRERVLEAVNHLVRELPKARNGEKAKEDSDGRLIVEETFMFHGKVTYSHRSYDRFTHVTVDLSTGPPPGWGRCETTTPTRRQRNADKEGGAA